MRRFAIPILATGLMLAACGGGVTLLNATGKTAPVGSVQLNGGANAADDSGAVQPAQVDNSDLNLPNPPVHKPGAGAVKPLAPQPAAVFPAEPAFGTAVSSCSGWHPPKVLCEAQ